MQLAINNVVHIHGHEKKSETRGTKNNFQLEEQGSEVSIMKKTA